MSDSSQSSFEKAVTALLFIGLAAAGWSPFIWATWREPFAHPPFLLFSAALGLLSLAFVYDSAERLIGSGKGIYAVAVACSFAPVGAVIADSGLLAVSALMFVTAAINWFAIRAHGRNRSFNLFMIAALLLLVGYLFSFFAGALVLLFGIWMAAVRSDEKPWRSAWLLVLWIVGSALRSVIELGIPLIMEIPAPENLPIFKALLLQLPWLLWVVPLSLLWTRNKTANWQLAAGLVIALLYAVGLFVNLNPLVIGAVAAPVLALSATELFTRWFAMKRREPQMLFSLPAVVASILLLSIAAVRIFHFEWFEAPSQPQALLAIFLCVLTITLAWRKFPRWNFAAMVGLGLLAGSLWWVRKELLYMEDPFAAEEIDVWDQIFNYLPVLLIAFVVVMKRLYGKRLPRSAKLPGDPFKFSGRNLRLFSKVGRREWSGEPIEITSQDTNDYRFAIFGDITGSEFPMTTRRGGYFVYRALAEEIKGQQASFAISVGDLATQASEFAYRRLRQILRHIPVPLAVAPGNHDLFAEDDYEPQFFHSLFGADNCSFAIGPLRYILLNNAWGSLDEKQYDWLKRELEANQSSFTFVFCHKPPIDPREEEFYGMEDREWAAKMHELFKQHSVTAVFSGHIHALLKHEQDGVTYIISGGGGSKLDAKSAVHHYLLTDVAPDKIIVRALPLETRDRKTESAPLMQMTFTAKS
jgi:hypothetical protein